MNPRQLIAGPVIDCIASDRSPTVHELFHVAERIWTDAGAATSTSSWSELPVDGVERLASLRAAKAALSGSDEHLGGLSGCAVGDVGRLHRRERLAI
jgi:hypothetical protein